MSSTRIIVSERETMGSLSRTLLIALMTLASVAFIFVVIALAMGGYNTYSNPVGNIEPISSGAPVLINTLECNDVSVPEECDIDGIDTDEGWIKVMEHNIPNQLPLCVDDATVAGWSIIYATCGGYELKEDAGCVAFYQKTGYKGSLCLVGTEITDTYVPDPNCDLSCCTCCNVRFFELTFEACCCGPCVCLDSNHVPSSPAISVDESCCDCGDFNCWVPGAYKGMELDKRVRLEFDLNWQGCNGADQSFMVILAHKNCIPGEPPSKQILIASK